MRVACVGEAMIELAMAGEVPQLGVAGDTLNAAIYLKRAAPALDVAYVTALGDDPFSDRIAAFIAGEGLDTSRIARLTGQTPGLYAITTDAAGERSFTYWRSTSAARQLFANGYGALDGVDAVYLSGISLAILPESRRWELLEQIKRRAIRLIFDSNYRPRLWENAEAARTTVAAYWSAADICLPSLDDEMALFKQDEEAVVARFQDLGADGALKRGALGPLCLRGTVRQPYLSATNVIDTTAAGDSFNAGYLAAHWSGVGQAKALRAGHDLAMRVVAHRGAILP